MRHAVFFLALIIVTSVSDLRGQSAVDVKRPEQAAREHKFVEHQEEKKAQATNLEIRGATAFKEKDLRSQLKEQIATINDFGLTAARADDAAFFLELFYRKHGYAKVSVHTVIQSGDHLRLEINEGPLMILGTVTFDGNVREPKEKLFEFAVGPTRERYSKLQKKLPFVASDIQEGADLVHRLYVGEGFLDAVVDKPRYTFHDDVNRVDALISVHEGRQYFFGQVSFTGHPIYDAQTLRGQIQDLLEQPYTEARVADIPRRLQAYYKARGYFEVKVDAISDPTGLTTTRVPVQVTIAAGPVYHFGDVNVNGLDHLRPSFVEKRFSKLKNKTYSPDVLDEKFRTLMRTGLFNVLRITPRPVEGDTLQLDIFAEEAKSKQFGFSAGYV